MIWDNSPAHRGGAIRDYLTMPSLNLRLVNLPSDSPDFNADEVIWGWMCQEATANLCQGTRDAVRETVGGFFTDLTQRREAVKRRCRTVLQAKADEINCHHPRQPSPPRKCRFHHDFGLGRYLSAQAETVLAVLRSSASGGTRNPNHNLTPPSKTNATI